MEFNSLDAQRDACLSYARSQPGWTVVAERYDDGGFTGANTERPAFQRLLHDIENKLIDMVIVYKVDRLSRSLLDFAKVMDRFNAAGCAFVSVTQNFSTADAMGRLTLNMLMSFAEFEREMISERTRDKIAGARRRGQWTGGRAPLGYRIEAGKLVVEPEEAALVREIFAEYLERDSLHAIFERLRSLGRTTKRHVSRGGRVLAGSRWTKDSVLRVLKNPLYAGRVRAGDELVEGQHPALVERAIFDAANARLGARRFALPRTCERYLLIGLTRCGECGRAMTPASARTRGREYRYYRCSTRDRRGKRTCSTGLRPAAPLEAAAVEHIRALSADPRRIEKMTGSTHALIARQLSRFEQERTSLPGAIAKLSADTQRLVDALPGVATDERDAAIARIERSSERVEARQSRLREVEIAVATSARATRDIAWIAAALTRFDREWHRMPPSGRARLAGALIADVVVRGRSGEIAIASRDAFALPGHRTSSARGALR